MYGRQIITTLVVTLGLLLLGCIDYFDYTPYGIESDNHQLTAINVARIEAASLPHFEPFRFAVISDTHSYYDELKKFVSIINQRNDIAFILVCGDITDDGLQQEYHWSVDLMNDLKQPYLTVIGNHDALTYGKQNYQAFFGEFDYSFTFNQVKFVALNSASKGFDHAVPRLDWLRTELSNYQLYRHQIVFTHVLPYPHDNPFSPEFSTAYLAAIKDNFVSLLAGGHDHPHHYQEDILSNGQTFAYMATGTINNRSYVLVNVEAERVTIAQVMF